ncbi:hypothetical protein DPMN_104081 [Dreissena polymorpha]|uniref:Uncharacterized protein n=1 Tax=Dreissena polymorpha TaxID=45954 RepID=A0A9D4K0T7_DREPO|nr:hypothetical protein DPMN_104081 [Dreissena polymorpha]
MNRLLVTPGDFKPFQVDNDPIIFISPEKRTWAVGSISFRTNKQSEMSKRFRERFTDIEEILRLQQANERKELFTKLEALPHQRCSEITRNAREADLLRQLEELPPGINVPPIAAPMWYLIEYTIKRIEGSS